MPIERPNNNLYRVRELSVGVSGDEYYLSMNPGKAKACVVCISRHGMIDAKDLTLTEDDLNYLFSGGKMDLTGYTLQGITGNQLAALAQYRNLQLKPPVHVQVWSMTTSQNGTVLYIPEDLESQMTLVPVSYRVVANGNQLLITLDIKDGYEDGDLMYRLDDHLPIPIPKKWIGEPIPLRSAGNKYQVIPAPAVEKKYIQKRN